MVGKNNDIEEQLLQEQKQEQKKDSSEDSRPNYEELFGNNGVPSGTITASIYSDGLDLTAKKNLQLSAFADTKVLLELMVLFTSTLLIYSNDCIKRKKAAETILLGSIAAFLANSLISIPCRLALEKLQKYLQYNQITENKLLLAFESILKVGSFIMGSFAVEKATMLPTPTWIEQSSTVAMSTGAFALFFPYVVKTVASLLARCGLLKKVSEAEDQIKQLQQMSIIARDALYLSGVAGMGPLLVIGKNACPDIHGFNALKQMVVTGGLSTAAWNMGLNILVERLTKNTKDNVYNETVLRPAATIIVQMLLTLPFSLIPAAVMNDESLEKAAKQQAIIVAALIVAVAVVAAVAHGVHWGLAKCGLGNHPNSLSCQPGDRSVVPANVEMPSSSSTF